ncbi:non-specific serine/threonine protein kinase [Lentzea flaviverrucosa]|nr:non-specific serine/threonine protein kinase [Lentzea flaviverrucosa]
MMTIERPLPGEDLFGSYAVPAPRRAVPMDESLVPGELTSLIGRGKFLEEAGQAFRSARVLTFVGPGGVGKTRVAERLVHAATDGDDAFECGRVHLAELLDSEDRLASVIAQAFGLHENSAVPAEKLVTEHLRSRRTLLLLDNCEHLVGNRPGSGPVPQLLRRLLRAAPGLRVLATSQIRLGVEGEHLLQVPPLCTGTEESADPEALTTVHEALRLLIVRARSVGVEITDADFPVANRLCRMLDGLPLAIELAASQLDVMSLRSIVEHPDLLELLVDGPAEEARHRTLRTMLELSQKLLSRDEQRMWMLMTVFEGGFDLTSAQAVCAGQEISRAQVQPLLSQLVRKSLLRVTHQDGVTRYQMLHVIRQFGHELLAVAEDASPTRARQDHADFFSDLARRGAELWLDGEVEWMHRLLTELPNLRAAQRHFLAHPQQRLRGLELAINLTRTRCHIFAGQMNDARRMLTLALQANAGPPSPELIGATSMLTWIALLQGQHDLAKPLLDRAERDAAALGLQDAINPLLYASATSIFLCERDPALAREALPALERAEQAFQRGGNAGDTFMGALFRAMAVAFMGTREQAVPLCDRLMASVKDSDAQWSISWATWTRGLVEFVHGSVHRAITLAQTALRIQRQIGDTWGLTWSTWLIAVGAGKLGDHELAGRVLGVVNSVQQDSTTRVRNMQPFMRVDSQIRKHGCHVLGEDRFEQAIGDGESLTVEDGLTLALTPVCDMHRMRVGEELLTPKERQVVEHIAQGKRYAEIGDELDISDRTVEVHVRNAKRKLDLPSKSQLIAWFLEPRRASA